MSDALLFIVNSVINLIIFIVLANAVISWLVVFDVLNVRNPQIGQIVRALDSATRPLLAPIRRFVPNLGGVDISPVILYILLQALQILIKNAIAPLLYSTLG
jgi:YggT family protein